MATASYKGKYKPQNKDKYIGNPDRVVYRSNWERRFMVYCDRNEAIKHWGSEEIAIRYRNPVTKKLHNYFPDFFILFVMLSVFFSIFAPPFLINSDMNRTVTDCLCLILQYMFQLFVTPRIPSLAQA